MKARSKFQHCLITNKSTSERGSSGRPVACEETARMLVMCSGKSDVINMTAIFNERIKLK